MSELPFFYFNGISLYITGQHKIQMYVPSKAVIKTLFPHRHLSLTNEVFVSARMNASTIYNNVVGFNKFEITTHCNGSVLFI